MKELSTSESIVTSGPITCGQGEGIGHSGKDMVIQGTKACRTVDVEC